MEQQPHNVILFGAGASCDAGIPLLGSFVDTMWNYAVRGKAGQQEISGADRDILFEANKIREELERYNSRAYFDLRNLEDILSLLSFEALNGSPHNEKYDKLVQAVARTIELSCKHRYTPGVLAEPGPGSIYSEFWHEILNPELRAALPAIITFNYDLVLERTLWEYFHRRHGDAIGGHVHRCAIKYDLEPYDFIIDSVKHTFNNGNGYRPEFRWGNGAEVTIPYYKLHGSLNWDKGSQARTLTGENVRPAQLPTAVVDQPLILPPVFNKMNSSALNGVWKSALTALRHAKNIVIVGYSLPKTDIYMQYFLKSAVGPNSDLQRIIVFDPVLFKEGPPCEEMKKRYRECFAPQFSDRIEFTPTSKYKHNAGKLIHFVRMLQQEPGGLLFTP